jgi:NADH-quinone oxidoreductase subunit J
MSIAEIIFLAFVGVTAGASIWLALSRNLITAAFLLFAVLILVSGLYVFAGAEFLAMSQIIIYVGGALIVILFGVMLTGKLREHKPKTEMVNLLPGILVVSALFLALLFAIKESNVGGMVPNAQTIENNTEAIGQDMLTQHLLPFELVSVLLLVVLTGAAYLSRKQKKQGEQKA